MRYFITTSGQSITELFRDDYMAPPSGAIEITEVEGEAIRLHGCASKIYVNSAVEDAPPVLPTKQQQIEELIKPVGLSQYWQLDGFMGGALALAMQQGLTEQQLIAANPAYAQASAIRMQVMAILSAP